MAPSHTPQCIVSDQPPERIEPRPSNISDIQHGNCNEVCWRECEGFCLFMTKNSSPPPPEYLWPALMGRFLIIRVIKEHNADGYQNYDKWQCPGTWTSLYTLHPLLLYRSPCRTAVQKINSPRTVQTLLHLCCIFLTSFQVLSQTAQLSAFRNLQFETGASFQRPHFGQGYFWTMHFV